MGGGGSGGGGGGGGGGSVAEGVRWGGWGWWGGGQGGCERNVGGRGDVGYGGCEPRIECCTMYKKVLYNIKKMKKCGVGGGGGGNI